MGVPEGNARALFKKVSALRQIRIHSVSTHLPVSNEDAEYTRDELLRFGKILKQFRADIPGDYKAHVLQSAGALAFNQKVFDMVRAGVMLYGISPLPEFQNLLRPAMAWKTRIALVRDMPKGSSISYGRTFITPRRMRVATLSTGYADGYPRHLSNREAAVLVRGQRCALLGRVTMDLVMIDVSHIEDRQCGSGGRGSFNGKRWKRGSLLRGIGREGRHDYLGNYDAHWRARPARLRLGKPFQRCNDLTNACSKSSSTN